MILQLNLAQVYQPQQTQSIATAIFYSFLGLIMGLIVLFLLYKLYRRMTYNIKVTVFERIGNSEIQYDALARQVKDEAGNYLIHYMGIGYSPVWKDLADYMRNVKTKMFGILPQTMKGFSVYKVDEKIVPLKVQHNPGFEPIDKDMFNYMVTRIQANIAKYQKKSQLMQLLPIIALGMVVLAFILGSIFWGKHVENIATNILGTAGSTAQSILESSGATQVLTPGG